MAHNLLDSPKTGADPDLVPVQQDNLWSRWVDIAFAKLDSNGDGFIDLDELIVRLPILTGTDNPEAERVLAVSFLGKDLNFMVVVQALLVCRGAEDDLLRSRLLACRFCARYRPWSCWPQWPF